MHQANPIESRSFTIATKVFTLMSWLGQRLCSIKLGGHDFIYKIDDSRLFLKCANCGLETPGWQVEKGKFAALVPKRARKVIIVTTPEVTAEEL